MEVIIHYNKFENSIKTITVPPQKFRCANLPVLDKLPPPWEYDDKITVMEAEQIIFQMTDLDEIQFDHFDVRSHYDFNGIRVLSDEEMSAIRAMLFRPKIMEATEMSMDGIYFIRNRMPSNFSIKYFAAAYLRPEDHTFWTLKYSGRQ